MAQPAARAGTARASGSALAPVTATAQNVIVIVAEDLGVDKVCDIFTQINSRGIHGQVHLGGLFLLHPFELI